MMTQLFETILYMSVSASILALLILGARALFGRRQTVMLTILFALLIAKLAIPLSIESPVSIHNLLSTNQMPEIIFRDNIQQNDGDTSSLANQQYHSDASTSETEHSTNVSQSPNGLIPETQTATQIDTPENNKRQPTFMDIAAIVWMIGAGVLAFGIALSNIRFMHKLKCNRVYSSPEFDSLLEECKKDFGIRHRIPAVQISEINTAAVCGVVRPKLLISPPVFDQLTVQEKRHVLMHELSHIKRRDTLVCLLATILNIIHWFNPILWGAFILMRKDLEVMCDAKVLKKLGSDERLSYATTLFGLIQAKGTKSVRLVTALFMSKSSIKRRITMIARYKKNSPLFIAAALLLTVMIAITGCTTGINSATNIAEESIESTEPSDAIVTEAPQDMQTSNAIPGDYKMTYTFDFSSYASDDSRVANIIKATGLLDGTIIQAHEDNHFIYNNPSFMLDSSWQEAPSLTWPEYFDTMTSLNWEPQASDTKEFETMQVGGGIDLVLGAIYKAFSLANIRGVNLGFFEDEFLNGGDLVITSGAEDDIRLQAIIEDTNLIIEIYYGNTELASTKTTETERLNVVTSITFDLGEYANLIAYSENIKKAANLLDGVVIAPNEEIDLFDYIHPVTEENGWQMAKAIKFDLNDSGDGVVASEILEDSIQLGNGSMVFVMTVFKALSISDLDLSLITNSSPKAMVTNNSNINIFINIQQDGSCYIIDVSVPTEASTTDPVFMTSFSLDYGDHLNQNTTYNVEKALGALDGSVIGPGQTFSINEKLGPRNAASGWKQAAGISSGVLTNQYGGGISAVSSALYNAAISAELQIVEKSNHSIMSDYVPGGLDATISTGAPDLKIKNPYDMDVTIKCRLNGDNIIIEIYGPPMDYTVDFTSEKIETTDAPEYIYHYNSETTPDGTPIPRGESVTYVKGRGQTIFEVYKTKYDLSGNEISTELFEKVTYRSYQGQIYVNVPDPSPTPSPLPTPSP